MRTQRRPRAGRLSPCTAAARRELHAAAALNLQPGAHLPVRCRVERGLLVLLPHLSRDHPLAVVCRYCVLRQYLKQGPLSHFLRSFWCVAFTLDVVLIDGLRLPPTGRS